MLECWSAGVLEMLESWRVGVLESWSAGELECWSAGVLEGLYLERSEVYLCRAFQRNAAPIINIKSERN